MLTSIGYKGINLSEKAKKKGAYYPVINPNSSDNAPIRFIGYYD
jgi:hypothetical protein